jgi:hypothetical protein
MPPPTGLPRSEVEAFEVGRSISAARRRSTKMHLPDIAMLARAG